jgi:acetylornithine/succinyldiaminopimelate/putrescine aminotransferase
VSGQAELQLNYGPLVSGFAHLTADHEAAVEHRIDEQTVAVLISPIDMHDACRPLSSPFLKAIRQRCDDVGALLIADESLVPFGTTGHAITTSFIGDIDVDAAIFAHGLFGDADGACVVGGDWLETSDVLVAEHLVQQAFLAASCLSLAGLSPWDSYAAQHHTFAITLAEKLRDFSFVRDLHAVGGCIGIELDWPASELLQAAQSEYALLGRAGEHGVRLELPLHCSADDQELLLVRLMEACQRVQRQASTASS